MVSRWRHSVKKKNILLKHVENPFVSAGGGGEDGGGDSFNSVTCFCGKPFAGRPMIECRSVKKGDKTKNIKIKIKFSRFIVDV
jgi:hypothetical protein